YTVYAVDNADAIELYILYHAFIYFLPLHATIFFFFFFNDTATTEIYTLSLHDALPISTKKVKLPALDMARSIEDTRERLKALMRSEEHTSELQSRGHLVCRLLLEKKKKEKNEI